MTGIPIIISSHSDHNVRNIKQVIMFHEISTTEMCYSALITLNKAQIDKQMMYSLSNIHKDYCY
jgi:hypothetical protein